MRQTKFKSIRWRALCWIAFAAFAICACAALVTRAQSPAPPKVTVNLLSDQAALQPGQTLWVGLQFQLPGGWHIYWENPGDSGEPPKIKWNLPQGFRAGDFLWPYPQRIVAPSIVDYGYPNGVVLLAPITVPTDLPQHGSVTLGGDVRYLVCREICVPGKTSVQLTLPVRPHNAKPAPSTTAAHALFVQTKQLVPQPAPAAWQPRAKLTGNEFVLSLRTGKPDPHAEFFPIDSDVIENSAAPDVRATATGIEIHLKKSDQLLKPIAQLRGVVVLPGRGAYRVDAPVAQ